MEAGHGSRLFLVRFVLNGNTILAIEISGVSGYHDKKEPRQSGGADERRLEEMDLLNTSLFYHRNADFTTDSWHKADGTLDLEAIRQFLQSMTDDELKEARTFLLAMKAIKEADERNQHRRRGRSRI